MIYLGIYIAIALWKIIAMILGILEAKLFHFDNEYSKRFKRETGVDIHIAFTVVRIILAGSIASVIWFYYDWIEAMNLSLLMITVFPFFHDGAYYQFRKRLSYGKTYPRGWCDRSTETTAIFSLGFYHRSVLVVIGLMLFLPF